MKESVGATPTSWTFGQDIDWSGALESVELHVELPFWLMMPEGKVTISWSEIEFEVSILQMQMEVFHDFFADSRQTRVGELPLKPELFMDPEKLARLSEMQNRPVFPRMCKTVLALNAYAHPDVFKEPAEGDRPAVARQNETYLASLCEAHIPVVNELIQRYRYTTYDYFPYEVSAWDVPVWALNFQNQQYRVLLIPYRGWDQRPVIIEKASSPEGDPDLPQFSWTDVSTLEGVTSADASPEEYDLLDARSLMERGDYTGAVRRTVTAMEALVGSKLRTELEKKFTKTEVDTKMEASKTNYPGRYKQWKKLSGSVISNGLEETFQETRQMRHKIVHTGLRLGYADRHVAQRAVDSGRWLFNAIEQLPNRVSIREHGALKSAGRVMILPRFPPSVTPQGIVLTPLFP